MPGLAEQVSCGVGGRTHSTSSLKPSWPPQGARGPTAESGGRQWPLEEAKDEEVEQGAMLQQLFNIVQSMQHDMQGLKGLVGQISQEMKCDYAIQQQQQQQQQQLIGAQHNCILEKMDALQDSIVNKLQRAMAQNQREVTDKHDEHCEHVETALQERSEYLELQLQALVDKVEERPIRPEVMGDESPIVAVKSFWSKQGLKRTSTKSVAQEVDVPLTTKQLVINFRRLAVVGQFFEMVHELIKSTAIAALTLVAAHTPRQGVFTMLFIVLVFLLYARHDRKNDGTDIADVRSLMPLVCNDDHKCKPGQTCPNGLLKSLSLQRRGWYRWGGRWVLITIAASTIIGWLGLICWHGLIDVSADIANLHNLHLHEQLALQFIGDAEDAGILAMQMIVLDIMVCLELAYEYVLWREMFMVMPTPLAGSTVWDPRVHGVPPFWLLGLPSVWFTSQEALHNLKQYAVFAQLGSDKNAQDYDLFPAELARYALEGDSNRCELSKALGESKLFDARQQEFVDTSGEIIKHPDEAETLGIKVCFFESQGYHFPDGHTTSIFKYPGQVQIWGEEVAGEEGAVVQAVSCRSIDVEEDAVTLVGVQLCVP